MGPDVHERSELIPTGTGLSLVVVVVVGLTVIMTQLVWLNIKDATCTVVSR